MFREAPALPVEAGGLVIAMIETIFPDGRQPLARPVRQLLAF